MNTDIYKREILEGLLQVDSSFMLTSFSVQEDKETRKMVISFTAQNSSGEEISGTTAYE